MRNLNLPGVLFFALVVVVGCGSGRHGYQRDAGADGAAPPTDSGTSSPDSSVDASDAGAPPTDTGGGPTDTAPPLKDTSPGPWDGTFTGPLTCTTTGSYASNWSGSCGTLRWSEKTGTDSAAPGVSLLPTLTTIASLTSIPGQTPSGARLAPTETTVWALKDVNLNFARLEDDSDYHLVLSYGATTMIVEVPYPGCVSGGPWGCLISRARAAVEANIGVSNLMLDMGHDHALAVSVIGVGFWDTEHGQFGASSNGIELHAVLAICFGIGCNPTLD